MILPNVSILMPTYNRNKFLNLILDNILNQSYPKDKLELVIIDDGPEKLLSDENNFRNIIFPIKLKYIRIDPKVKLLIGTKRNYLVDHASNEICINMDDDDIYFNNYILKSVITLLIKNASLVGSNQMLFYFHQLNKFTKIKCKAKRQIHEATMCFTKNHWKKTKGFLQQQTGEGPGMIDGHEENIVNIDIDMLMCLVVHKGNTYPKDAFIYKKEIDIKLNPNKQKILNDIFKYIKDK